MILNITKNIFFTGFMATGKSRIGSLVAASLGWTFQDLDHAVEEKSGLSVAEIFARHGEAHFRTLEIEALREISQREKMVISLGGGTLQSPAAIELVKNNGVLIALWAPPEVILERVNRKQSSRPLLANLNDTEKLEKIKRLLNERKALYDLAQFRFESCESIPHHVLTRTIIHRLQVDELNPLQVALEERSYPIYVEKQISNHVDSIFDKWNIQGEYLIVTDNNLRDHQFETLEHIRQCLGEDCRIFYFKSGEEEKNLKSLNKLFTYMLRQGYSRKTTLVAFSGGVVGDMTGFAASIYLRGIPFVQIPTTLLSMVDSSVGGKTGINHPLGKNMIGSFYQPKAVLIQLDVLSTLPDSEFLAGLAEVIKYAVIWDPEFFEYLDKNRQAILARDLQQLNYVVRHCCSIKAEVVRRDERESSSGVRAFLNYGHTFGHALEVLANFNYTHGLAVALGMRAAARLAVDIGLLSPADEQKQNALLDAYGLPQIFPRPLDLARAWEAMGMDKKVEAGERVYILPTRIGEVKSVRQINREAVLQAMSIVKAPATEKIA